MSPFYAYSENQKIYVCAEKYLNNVGKRAEKKLIPKSLIFTDK
jgi:hypothetical protein